MDFTLFDRIFNRISEGAAFFDIAEKRQLIKSLRTLYFFPDELLKYLNQIIDTEASDPSAAISAGAKFAETEGDADAALKAITSPSLVGNLKLSIEMIEGLRQVASYKTGVRGLLHGIFFSWTFSQDRKAVLELATAARDEISYLNSKIRNLENALLHPKE